MSIENKYICVVCGNNVDALYKQYGPTVIKVSNCHRCGSISDKYIEYDPVIIMVDLILLSKEAYRHVLYNTSFKAYWKLFIVLIALETYIEWSNHIYREKLTSLKCMDPHGVDPLLCNRSMNQLFSSHCKNVENKVVCQNKSAGNKLNQNKYLKDDPFLTEKGVYVTFCCVCIGMAVFSIAVFILSILSKPSFIGFNKVNFIRLLKGLTLGGMGNLLMLPTIIWGSEHDTSIHAPVVLAYTTLALIYIHSVMFECSKMKSFVILMMAFILKISARSYFRNLGTFLMDT